MWEIQQLMNWANRNGIDVRALASRAAGPDHHINPKDFKEIDVSLQTYNEAKKAEYRPGSKIKGMTLSQHLETLDPSYKYENCPLDAFDRQLAVRGLVVKGPAAVTLEEFYDSASALFPEWIDRQVRVGRLFNPLHLTDDDLVVVEESVNSGAFEAVQVDMTKDYAYSPVGEGAEPPVATLGHSTVTGSLRKHMFKLKVTYEFLRRVQMPVISVYLQLVGQQLMFDKAEQALNVLINGTTGNNNPASTYAATGLTLNNLIAFEEEFAKYMPSLLIMNKASKVSLRQISEFASAQATAVWLGQSNSDMPTPIDNRIKRHDSSTTIIDSKVVGVDTRYALKRIVEAGGRLTETDKLISSQWNEIVISEPIAYDKIIENGNNLVWDYS
ncbi:MAG: hypothetical protein ACE5I1_27585 [bacterium]